MLTVIETPLFLHTAAQIWSSAGSSAFVDWIAEHSDSGDAIAGTAGLRKVRWSRADMGKPGGARVIYFNRPERGEVVLLVAYAKSKLDNIRPEFLIKLKEQFHG